MTGIRPIIEHAVASAIAEHPKYFTERGLEKAQAAITRKVMAALFRSDSESGADAGAPPAPPAEVGPLSVDPKSAEGRAYINLRSLAGASAPFRMQDGNISLPPEAQKPAVYALADLPALPWPFITDRQQTGAWMEFLADALPKGVARKPIQTTRDGVAGISMPWPWPPSVTGKVYTVEDAP
jgi:hypothetical protein